MMSFRFIWASLLALTIVSLLIAGYVFNYDEEYFVFNQIAWVLIFIYCTLVSPDWFKVASYILTLFAVKKLKDELFNIGSMPHVEDKYIIIGGILTFLGIVYIRTRKRALHGK